MSYISPWQMTHTQFSTEKSPEVNATKSGYECRLSNNSTSVPQAGCSLFWFRLTPLQNRIKLNRLRAGLGQKLTSSWGTNVWCQNWGHCSVVLRLLGRTEVKEKANDKRDAGWGLHNSAVRTILEKVMLLLPKIFCGWHENTPAGLCPFLLTEPSVAITWEFCSDFLVTIYGVSFKNSELINRSYWCFRTEKKKIPPDIIKAFYPLLFLCSWILEI